MFVHFVYIVTFLLFNLFICNKCATSELVNKTELKLKVKEMFLHAYYSYKNNAFPADELMPLSCKGRVRGIEPNRGDIDDALGNFSLTMIDSLDTLFLFNELDEFEDAVRLVLKTVTFDSDFDVSVFETNIRVLGGLLGAHVSAMLVKNSNTSRMSWYQGELLTMAVDIGTRLLPAFNTSTGIPYSRVNLRRGNVGPKNNEEYTCTACAGTIILEFAALSRMTGNFIFEEKAAKALTFLWKQRNRYSDLIGRVINVHSGDWIRQDSGVGAGIDSYYEYLLKAYILLGEPVYFHRFQTHYDAINRYVSGPESALYPFIFLDVYMHKPSMRTRSFMDALVAFWPGLQVLTGDVKQAVALHELLFLIHKRNRLLPEAFTPDFNIHWGHHLLRPELIESTYFLFSATADPYYLDVGRQIVRDLEMYTRVPCGFAAIKDVRTMQQSDQFDSFVLAETFKYLYLLFSDPSDLPINLNDYLFTTEAHILPLSLSRLGPIHSSPLADDAHGDRDQAREQKLQSQAQCSAWHYDLEWSGTQRSSRCFAQKLHPSIVHFTQLGLRQMKNVTKSSVWTRYDQLIRQPLRNLASNLDATSKVGINGLDVPLLAENFQVDNANHLKLIKRMGIEFSIDGEMGKFLMIHNQHEAESPSMALLGATFIQEMISSAKSKQKYVDLPVQPNHVVLVNSPDFGLTKFSACPAHFGHYPGEQPAVSSSIILTVPPTNGKPLVGVVRVVHPSDACGPIDPTGFAYASSKIEWNGPWTEANQAELLGVDTMYQASSGPIAGAIGLVRRGGCLFIEKARHLAKAGAIGGIVLDTNPTSSVETDPMFTMSGDNDSSLHDIHIPFVLLFGRERNQLLGNMRSVWLAQGRPQTVMLTRKFDWATSFNMAMDYLAENSPLNHSSTTSKYVSINPTISLPSLHPTTVSSHLINHFLGFGMLASTDGISTLWTFNVPTSSVDYDRFVTTHHEEKSISYYVNNVTVWQDAFNVILIKLNVTGSCKDLFLAIIRISLYKATIPGSSMHPQSNITLNFYWFNHIDECFRYIQRLSTDYGKETYNAYNNEEVVTTSTLQLEFLKITPL